MKRITLIVTGIALALALCLDKTIAQDNPPPAAQQPVAPPPGQPVPGQPVPGQPPFQRPMMPPRVRQPRMFVQRTMSDLRMLKTELQRSQDDFGGHKASAMDACDKAMQELDALMKAMPLPTPQQGGPPPGANRGAFQNNAPQGAPGAEPAPGQTAPVPPPGSANPPAQPPPQP